MLDSINHGILAATVGGLTTKFHDSHQRRHCDRECGRANIIIIIIQQNLQCAKRILVMIQNCRINKDICRIETKGERIIIKNNVKKKDDCDSDFYLVYPYLWKYTFYTMLWHHIQNTLLMILFRITGVCCFSEISYISDIML